MKILFRLSLGLFVLVGCSSLLLAEVPKFQIPAPADVQVVFQDFDGKPLPSAVGYAYSPELGVTVLLGIPSKKPHVTGALTAPGIYSANLCAGNWQIIGFAEGAGGGTYISRNFPAVKNGDTLILRPNRRLHLTFCHGKNPLDVESILAMDSRFARWLECRPLGSSKNGKFVLDTLADLSLDLMCWKSPQSQPGVLLTAHVEEGLKPADVVFDSAKTGRLRLESSSEAPVPTSIELALACPAIINAIPFKTTGSLPLDVCITPGTVEAEYSFTVSATIGLKFTRKDYPMAVGQTQTLRLGGPFEYSVYHFFGHRAWERGDRLTFQLFVRDTNGNTLYNWHRTAGRGRLDAPFEIREEDRLLLSGTILQPTCIVGGTFESEHGVIPAGTDFNNARFRFTLPFENASRLIPSHGADFQRTSEHYLFRGPHEAADSADAWLAAAETTYRACLEVMGDPVFAPKNGRRALCLMPRTISCAPGFNAHFPAMATLHASSSSRIFELFRTAFVHEIVHTFGPRDGWFRLQIQQAVSERIPDIGIFRRREGGNSPWDSAIISTLRGEPPRQAGLDTRLGAALQIVGAHFGFRIFAEEFAKYRQVGQTMADQGISEEVIHCVLLDSLTSNQASLVFKAAGIPLPEDQMNKAHALLAGSP